MAASPDDRIPSSQTDRYYPSDRSQQRILSQFQGDWVNRLNLDQMFVLIDGVLPFEACLYYQVLPLFLDGNRLNLGMVSPEDITAAEYVRRIISYLNYSLVTRRITADALQTTLTAYLHAAENKQTPDRSQPERVSFGHHRHTGRNRVARSIDQTERLTLVVDSPDELEESQNSPAADYRAADYGGTPADFPPDVPAPPPEIALPQPPLPGDVSPAGENNLPASLLNSSPAINRTSGNRPASSPLRDNASIEPIKAEPAKTEPIKSEPAETVSASLRHPALSFLPSLPVLQVQANHLSASAEELMLLPPNLILQELLARVLIGGIGRLYFENHTHYGRILWSQNGVLQSVLENVPIALFQDILTALKQTAKLTLPIKNYPKQVEAEYLYRGSQSNSRVLLRFRFMLSAGNEEATLQILRGAALKFHQQQQMRKLERDAVGIAKQLQGKLNEIRDRARMAGNSTHSHFDVLPDLSDLLRGIEQQLDELGINPSDLPQE